MSKFPNGLRAAMTKAQVGASELARLVDTPRQNISRWAAGERKLTAAWATKLAPFLNTTPEILLFPESDRPIQEVSPGPEVRKSDLGPRDVPVLGISIGGSDGEEDDRNPDFWLNGEHVDHVRRPPGLANMRHVFALYVRGESMVPRYREGELIFVQQAAPAIGDDVVIELKPKTEGGETASFVKELVRRRGSYIVVKQYNPAKELEFGMKEIQRIFRVIPTKEWVG